jgi:hypothetical protein
MAKRGMRPEDRARRMQALIEIVIQHPRLLTVEERADELIGDTETMMKVNRKRAADTRGNEHASSHAKNRTSRRYQSERATIFQQ